jgi:uncharacterized phage protein (TIGR01671 family)
MKRKIKFRGQCIKSNNFVFGDLIHGVGPKSRNMYILPNEINLAYVKHCDPLDGVKVIPETVGQFTGLVDKNGVEIYEGDIFQYNEHYAYRLPSFKAIVEYNDYYACFGYQKVGSFFITSFHEHDELHTDVLSHCEVIGNIYENPSLLEVPS